MIRFTWVVLFALRGLNAFASPEAPGFIFFGDWGQGNRHQKAVAAGIGEYCRHETCDFITALGDNFYPSGVKSTTDSQWKTKFHDVYDFLRLRFYVALGNHDYSGSIQAQMDYSRVSGLWAMPTAYYEFIHGDIHFFVIDTNAFDARQATWLKQKIAASRSPWKVVYGHHPLFSTGWHGDTKSLGKDLLPLLRGRVDFYLAGHDHHKEALAPDSGVNFFISGAAAETRAAKGGSRTLFKSATLGFAHFELKGQTVRVRFLDQTGKVEWEKLVTKARAPGRLPVFP